MRETAQRGAHEAVRARRDAIDQRSVAGVAHQHGAVVGVGEIEVQHLVSLDRRHVNVADPGSASNHDGADGEADQRACADQDPLGSNCD